MKDKFTRAVRFVQDHPVPFAYGFGVIIGASVTTSVYLRHPVPTMPQVLDLFVRETPEGVKELMENNAGTLRLNLPQARTVFLHTEVDLDV